MASLSQVKHSTTEPLRSHFYFFYICLYMKCCFKYIEQNPPSPVQSTVMEDQDSHVLIELVDTDLHHIVPESIKQNEQFHIQ